MAFSIGDFFPLRGSRMAARVARQRERDRAGSSRKGRADAPHRRFALEQVEPRVLLSADSLVGGLSGSLSAGLQAVGDEIVQLIETDPLLTGYVPGIVETRTSGDQTFEVSPTLGESLSIFVDVSTSYAAPEVPVGNTLVQRWQAVNALTGTADDASDELALRQIDLDNSGEVSWDEVFNVVFAGRLQNYLASPAVQILDQDSDSDVDTLDLAKQVEAVIEGFDIGATEFDDPLWFLSDRVVLTVDGVSSSVKNGTLSWNVDFAIGLVQRDRFDLGYEADKLGLQLDPGVPPDPNNNPFKIAVKRTVEFGSFTFGVSGVGDSTVAAGDFFFAAPDRPSDPDDGMRIGIGAGTAANPVDVFIPVNFGFLGATVVASDAPTKNGFFLDMALEGQAVDPSNVSALGFTAGVQGVQQLSGSIEGDATVDLTKLAATAIEFSLQIGTDPDGTVTEVTLPAGTYADAAAVVTALNTALGAAGLGALVTAADADNDSQIEFNVVATSSASELDLVLGFQLESFANGVLVGAAASSLIGGGTGGTASFLLSVGGGLVKKVTVNVTPDPAGPDGKLSADTGVPADDDDNDQVHIDSLVEDLQAALDAAFGAGVVTAGKSGSALTLTAAGRIEITRTLTLDTVDRITIAELTGPAEVLEVEQDGDARFLVNLKLQATEGLQNADDSAYAPTGTIRVDLNPFTPNAVKPFIVDQDPVTGEDVVRANYQLTDVAGVPLTGGNSDLQTMLDFNVINVADILGTFGEIGNWFNQLSGASLLQGFDLPFADATLGKLLNFKDLLDDTFLINDRDDGPTKNGAPDVVDEAKLLKWVGALNKEKLVAMFGNAQQLETRLNDILPGSFDVDATVVVDGNGQRLEYQLSVADITLDVEPNVAGDQALTVPLDFELELGPVANFTTDGKLTITAQGDIGFTLGIKLGDAVDALDNSTELLSLNSDAGVKLNTNLALTSLGIVQPLVGRLTADAVFTITTLDETAPNTFVATGEYTVTVLKSLTNTNRTIGDLVADINTALGVAGLTGRFVAVAEPVQGNQKTARIVLKALDATVDRFNLNVSTVNTAYTELGLRTQAAATVALAGSKPAPTANPGDFTLDFVIKRAGALLAQPASVNVTGTAENVALQSLVNDINAALTAAGIGIVASQSGGALVFSAVDADIEAFSIADNDAIGLDVATANQRYLGYTALPSVLVAGPRLQGGDVPADPFGRVAASVTFSINGTSITIDPADTATNVSFEDLVRTLNGKLGASLLAGQVAAVAELGRIVLVGVGLDVEAIEITGLAAGSAGSLALGMADGNSIGGLGVRTTANAPLSYGVDQDATFTLNINGVGGLTKDITLSRDNTIGNRSVFDLAASLNNALNTAIGGINLNPLIATVQAGQIVIGLKTSGASTNLIGDPRSDSVPAGGIKASDVTSFSLNSASTTVKNDLRLVDTVTGLNAASPADFIVFFRDGSSAAVALDALDTDGDQKLDATLGALITALEGAALGKLDVGFNTDGTSLVLQDLTAGTALFRVVAVNGSPAAAQLGILGSDTSNLNVGEVPAGSAVADGVIDGGKIAVIDLKDRVYLRNLGASADIEVKTAGVVSAEATFGFAGIRVESTDNQTLFSAKASLPILDAEISLTDLFDKLGSASELQTLVGDPTLELNADFTFAVSTFPDASVLIDNAGSATIGFITTDGGADDVADTVTIQLADMLPANPEEFPSLPFKIVAKDFGDLLKFQTIEFGNVIDALQAIAEFLKQFEALQFLEDDIPVLGLSVNDLIDLADDFQAAIDDFRNNPAGGIQVLAQKIREALGLPEFGNLAEMGAFFANLGLPVPAALTQLIDFDIDGDILRFDLRLPVGFNKGLNVDLDLGDALGVDLGPIDIQGGAGLAASGYLDAQLSFGIDLTDPTQLHIYDDATSIVAGLDAKAQNLQFNAAFGPIGVFIKDGLVDLSLDGSVTVGDGAPGAVVIDLTDGGASLDSFLGSIAASLTGSAKATLPVYFPSDSEYLDDIEFEAGFSLGTGNALEASITALEFPDLTGIDLSSINPFGSIPLMLDTLDFFLLGLQDIMDGEVFNVELPLIGDQLQGAANFIDDFRRDVLAPVRQFVEQAPDLGLEIVQKLLYSLLGPGSTGVQVTNPLTSTTQSLASFLGVAEYAGLNILKDYDGGADDGETGIGVDDIKSTVSGSDDNFEWLFRLGQSFNPTVDIDFDLGIPALALDMDVGLDVTIDWDLALGLGVGVEDGAYLFIGDHRGTDAVGDAELLLELSVALTEGSGLRGSLGFLQLDISDSAVDDPGLEGTSTFIAASISVDLVNSADSNDERLSFSELGSIDADVSIAAEAEVNLDVTARFNPDIIPDAVSALLPEVGARFVLDWETGNLLDENSDFADSLQLVGFRDVNINMGSFINEFLKPFVDKVAEVTEPLQPIIDVITAPIPVISDLAGQPISLVDIAGMTGYVEPAMIYAIADIISLVNKIGGGDYGALRVPLGDFMLVDSGSGNSTYLTGASLMTPGYSLKNDSKFDEENLKAYVDGVRTGSDALGAFGSLLSGATANDASEESSRTLVNGLRSGSEGGGFAFPIFDDPSLLFGLLLGKDIPLITYDLAPFGMDFSYVQKFPVWDALFVRIGGSVGLSIDLAFGYDTFGVREFAEGGFSNPLDLLGGLYVSDTDQPSGEGTDVPELILKGELFAGAELNLGIASAGAEGVIGLQVDFDLYDPDSDGRVRVDELLGNFLYEFNYGSPALAPIAIFDVTGEVYAQLRAFVEALFFKYTFEITPPITLFEFSIPFEREPFLATERGDGSLLLNIGPNAAQRLNGDTRDIDEKVYVESISTTEVRVWNDTTVRKSDAQVYKVDPAKGIFGFGGAGNDIIDLSLVTHVTPYTLEGGDGDDTILGSAGGGSMKGGLGNDKLTGGSAADLILGGEGNDTIDAKAGADVVFGDSGVVSELMNEAGTLVIGDRYRSFVGVKDGDDKILGGDDADIIFGGGGNDWIEGGLGNDIVLGDGGNFDRPGYALKRLSSEPGARLDVNARGTGGKDTLLGNAGNDVLFGGASDDLIDGGADSDEIEAGVGFDVAYGGSGADTIYGGENDDIIFGFRDPVGSVFGQAGDTGDSDETLDGVDTVFGESGNDYIRGNRANDVLRGGAGADILFGDEDDDHLYGEAGGDILFGGADDDFIDGSDGADIAFGDDGLVAYVDYDPAAGDFTTTGSRIRTIGGDQLIGDSDAALIAGYVADTVATSVDLIVTKPLASDGSDTIIGGDGKDTVFGGGGLLDKLYGDFDPAAGFSGPRPNGQDLLIGDGGRVELTGRRNARAAAVSDALDGIDHISGNDGGDFIFGGGASDTVQGFHAGSAAAPVPLTGVSDNDIVLGDNGEILFDATDPKNLVRQIRTIALAGDSGRSDVLDGDFGNDVIFGGMNGSSDVITGDVGDDILVGDNGEILFDVDGNLDTIDRVESFRDGLGGVDIISGNAGNDILIGGTAGDTMGGADGEDILLGDNARIVLTGPAGRLLVQVAAMTAPTAVDFITTTDTAEATGGADTMSGDAEDDILFGGVNDGGIDTLYGDSVTPVHAADGNDILVGDNGLLDFTLGSDTERQTLDLIRSTRDGLGGTDHIYGNAGSDIAVGGTGGDLIGGDNPAAAAALLDLGDILVGDNADIFTSGAFGAAAQLTALGTGVAQIKTTDDTEATGGVDTISGHAGSDVVLGGVAGDSLYGDAATPVNALDGDDVLLGDNGQLDFGADRDVNLDPIAADDLTTLDLIESFTDGLGGVDTISGNAGSDTAMGGTAGDTLHGDNAAGSGLGLDSADMLLGDNGFVWLVSPTAAGAVTSGNDRILVLGGAVVLLRSTDQLNLGPNPAVSSDTGGSDLVAGNAGGDIILGGVDGDVLHGDRADISAGSNALDGHDVILGDNGALEWLSTGRLSEIDLTTAELEAINADLVDGFTARDNNLGTLDLITTEQPNNGGRDLVFGGNGRDTVFAGTDADTVYGDSGREAAGLAGISTAGRDLIFGDHGRLYPQFSRTADPQGQLIESPSIHARNFFAIDMGFGDGGEGDRLWGEEGDDIMLGQQGDDRIWGGSGDDDMVGGHNIAGGADELGVAGAIEISILGDAFNDAMDGGGNNDAMAGDNTTMWRRADSLDPRFRALTAPTIYTTTESTVTLNIGEAVHADPAGTVGRDITLLDHSQAIQDDAQYRFGRDVMAGGAQQDTMFGQLGDDLMQGDGSIAAVLQAAPASQAVSVADDGGLTGQTLHFNVVEAAGDGNDYLEGNGGNDLMYGGLGQDDMIGGSSSLYGLSDLGDPDQRPDGSDTMYGGAGIRIARLDAGDLVSVATADEYARDADQILGDNANVYRLVHGGTGAALTYLYDTYGSERIIVRGVEWLDYTLGGPDFDEDTVAAGLQNGQTDDRGAGDYIRGEAGNDFIHGMTGADILFGDAHDDDVTGGYGHDWISGGTGRDGVIGDDGIIRTSRNSTVGEPLFGVAGLTGTDTRYSDGDVLGEVITTPGSIQRAVINEVGDLVKAMDLTPLSVDASWMAIDDEFGYAGQSSAGGAPYADDVIYGGLDSDWLHGGSGDDAISGAEALPMFFDAAAAARPRFFGALPDNRPSDGTADDPATAGVDEGTSAVNKGDQLRFNAEDLDGKGPNRERAGEFALYDEYAPLRQIRVTSSDGYSGDLTWRQDPNAGAAAGYDFFLNFNEGEGVQRASENVPTNGKNFIVTGVVHDDGDDKVFGGTGNDWLVGGTGRDNLYGGWGNDLMNADDIQDRDANANGTIELSEVLNDTPDTHSTYEDRAYGGAGRDVLIGNTGGDRLIDWVGEWNSYLVPFAPFGMATVSRTLQPQLPEFLYALSRADGADPTIVADGNGTAERNGEPYGELGLVLQKDVAWQDQTGAPADPQAGNIPGGKRDVLRSADFNNQQGQGFVPESGTWTISSGKYTVAPSSTSSNKDAISLYFTGEPLPTYFEVGATINAIKPTAGFKANAYIIFDYVSPTDFKFAGINVSTNKVEIGQRASWGFQVLKSANMLLKSGQDYNVLLAVNGTAVTFVVNGKVSVSHAFAPRVDSLGIEHPIRDGMVGLGGDNARARVDDVRLQVLSPNFAYEASDEFDAAASLLSPAAGSWSQSVGRFNGAPGTAAGLALADNGVAVGANAVLQLDAEFSLSAGASIAGITFDKYTDTDFKWAGLSMASKQVLVGHYTAKGGWVVDQAISRPDLTTGVDYKLGVTLKGSTVSVTLNGSAVLSRAYNAGVVDGAVGVFAKGGPASFDSFGLKTDDVVYAAGMSLSAASTSTVTGTTSSGPTERLSTAAAPVAAGTVVSDPLATSLSAESPEPIRLQPAWLTNRLAGDWDLGGGPASFGSFSAQSPKSAMVEPQRLEASVATSQVAADLARLRTVVTSARPMEINWAVGAADAVETRPQGAWQLEFLTGLASDQGLSRANRSISLLV